MQTYICKGKETLLSVPDTSGRLAEAVMMPFVSLTQSNGLRVGAKRISDNSKWSCGEALWSSGEQRAWPQLDQAWRAMKLLERMPASFRIYDLPIVWDCAKGHLHLCERYSLIFLEEYFPSSIEAAKVRREILDLVISKEEFETMAVALEAGLAKNELLRTDRGCQMAVTHRLNGAPDPVARRKTWQQVKRFLEQLFPRG